MDRIGYVPKTCVWEITKSCNLRCAHCGTSAGGPRQDELDTEQCLDLVNQLADLGCRLVTLSGGEPTLRGDWVAIARGAVDRGVTVNMVTNGQSADPEQLARQVREAGLSNIGVSLDGLREVHDGIRRPGAFDRASHTIEGLVRAGIWVDVMLTANRLNLRQIPQVYRLTERLGARGFRVQLGKPMGNQTERDDLTLAPRHLLELLPMLGKLATSPGPCVNVGDSVGYFSPQERLFRSPHCSHGHWTGCWAGCQTIGIQSDGGIKGCLSLQPREGEEDRFIEGNVREHSLAEIWLRPGAFAYNRQASPKDLGGACAGCEYGAICRGGARCVSYAFTGEPGRDPMCWHAAAMAEAGTRRRSWTHAAAAAAAAMLMGLGAAGCADSHVPGDGDADVEPGDGDIEPGDGDIEPGDGDVEPPNCAEVDCECFTCDDYGLPSPAGCDPCSPMEEYEACCCEDVSCEDPCPMCDYGIWEPSLRQQVCCSGGGDSGDPEP
jgi:MoaA/NifB/PqqE/SkfB family radical SAM enzyme